MFKFRPDSPKNRVTTDEDWELCYLRHGYIRKVGFNPTPLQMEPYEKIIQSVSKSTYFTYRGLMFSVGFELDDIMNIGRTHLISFLGLFSLESQPKKYQDFVNSYERIKGKPPSRKSILDKNKANLTMFLKQRMEEIVRISRQKARNIKGFYQEEYMAFKGPNKVPSISRREFLENYSKYGFKKIDLNNFRAAKNKVKYCNPWIFTFEGQYYIALQTEFRLLSLEDFIGAEINPHDNLHYMGPDQMLSNKEEDSFWSKKLLEFDNYGEQRKKKVLTSFIRRNAGKTDFKEELFLARKLLKELRVYKEESLDI